MQCIDPAVYTERFNLIAMVRRVVEISIATIRILPKGGLGQF